MARKSTPDRAATFRRRLLRWFRRHGRDLPWRRTRDPYHVLVSEFMLQQTQVSRVEAYYHRFLERYPTVESLARSEPAMVRESWAGLGYYRRAANLHRLARTVVDQHGGVLPSDPGACWSACPASAAIRRAPWPASPTSGPTPAIDTNVARVIRRAFHPRLAPGRQERRLWETGAAIVPRRNGAARLGVQPGDHGARRADLYRPGSAVRRVPGEGGVRDGDGKRCRTGKRAIGRQGAA